VNTKDKNSQHLGSHTLEASVLHLNECCLISHQSRIQGNNDTAKIKEDAVGHINASKHPWKMSNKFNQMVKIHPNYDR
jgi:hypothetical protein